MGARGVWRTAFQASKFPAADRRYKCKFYRCIHLSELEYRLYIFCGQLHWKLPRAMPHRDTDKFPHAVFRHMKSKPSYIFDIKLPLFYRLALWANHEFHPETAVPNHFQKNRFLYMLRLYIYPAHHETTKQMPVSNNRFVSTLNFEELQNFHLPKQKYLFVSFSLLFP